MNRPEEISNIIKNQIKNYNSKIDMTETGKVILVGDGIARVYGLRNCMANELLEFEDGSFGMAQNLSPSFRIRIISARARPLPARERFFPSRLAKSCSAVL